MDTENCPCCPNHCPKDNLGCSRGRDYFADRLEKDELQSLNEAILADLRICGHMLHHNRDIDIDKLLADFEEEELAKLHELLSKMQDNFR